jgi:hypothetical protein
MTNFRQPRSKWKTRARLVSVREKFESGYWRRVKFAVARWCEDNGREKLTSAETTTLRHGWHQQLKLPERVTWNRHHYTVAFRFLETYAERGELAALALDGAALYRQAYRDGCIWVITHRVTESYLEPLLRNLLHLESWEAVPALDQLDDKTLSYCACTASQRARDGNGCGSGFQPRSADLSEPPAPGFVPFADQF